MASRPKAGVMVVLMAGGAAVVEQWMALRVQIEGDPALAAAARAMEADLEGADSAGLWGQARRLAPRSAGIGVNLGLALERAGRRADAEQVLVETCQMNALWLPRWSLASFYLRNQRGGEAARWGRLALARSYAGVRPALFALLREAGVPSEEWLAWCGESPEMLAGAVEYFGEAGEPGELAHSARLLAMLGPGRAPAFWRDSLKRACSRLVRKGEGAAAREVWNALVARGALPYELIGAGNLIGNPGFADPLDGEGFNWRFRPLPGVSRIFDAQARRVRVRFDGSQPESCELLAVEVWLEARRSHRLTCRYRSKGTEAEQTGPVWTLGGARSLPLAPGAGPQDVEWPQGEWRTSVLDLPAAGAGKIAVLALTLDRRPGFTRANGEVELGDVKLEVLP